MSDGLRGGSAIATLSATRHGRAQLVERAWITTRQDQNRTGKAGLLARCKGAGPWLESHTGSGLDSVGIARSRHIALCRIGVEDELFRFLIVPEGRVVVAKLHAMDHRKP